MLNLEKLQKKRDFRKLWITRINAACRLNEISYSKFISGLNKAEVTVNRKMLAEIAIDSPKAFADLVTIAKDALEGKVTKRTVKVEKTTKAETAKEETKKETTKKPAAKKTTTAKKETTKKETVKKETAEKKPAAKKPAAKKTTTKKTEK